MAVRSKAERICAFLTALVLIAVSLSGCSVFRKRGASAGREETETPVPSASPSPGEGGALRMPIPVNASFSDPLDVDTEEMLNLFSLIYDRLITVNSRGELEPCLCESWSDEGGGTWLLNLREGVKWHDGKGELTSADVLFTYDSLVEMESSYYKPCLTHIIGLEAVDELTIRARMDVPGLMGLYSFIFPIKKDTEGIVGTGPYKLEYQSENAILLNVNTEWWDKIPYLSIIAFYERDSNATSLASYEAGQLNIVPTDLLTAGKYSELGVTSVHDIMTQNMETLIFNHEDSVFSDRYIRLAAAHAVNRSRIITNVYMNRARVADSPIPPDSWLSTTRSSVIDYDVDLALSLILDAGYTILSGDGLRYSLSGSPLKVRLLTSSAADNTIRSDAAAMIAEDLGKIGFHVEIVTAEHDPGDRDSDFMKALREGDWDMALVGFNLGLDNELSRYVQADGANNFGHISDPDLETLSRRMLNASTEEDLRNAAYDLHEYFVDNVPFMTLYFRLNSIICSATILGMDSAREPFVFSTVKDWYLDPGIRKQ